MKDENDQPWPKEFLDHLATLEAAKNPRANPHDMIEALGKVSTRTACPIKELLDK